MSGLEPYVLMMVLNINGVQKIGAASYPSRHTCMVAYENQFKFLKRKIESKKGVKLVELTGCTTLKKFAERLGDQVEGKLKYK